ncbi:zinc metalloprotease [Chitinophaga japonensis]|uniref:Pregnancy-associated plasma protein-A n=1 Tax=Chitinophaga japonensis TaxID=104662 RepID=A0A562T2T4_CHIJA|nr:zinc metalloprotease [Chitinophaga japonensis]TWI87040.1 pregnancy-associated plasma protein-A [Chitinophaga japonensis]
MKKLVILIGATLLMAACSKQDRPADTPSTTPEETAAAQRKCGTMEVLKEQLKKNPSLGARMQAIETHTQRLIKEQSLGRLLPDGSIEIPVVVNVLYRTTAQNISLAQIQSQIDILEEDYNAGNSEYGSVPALFSGVKASVGIHFSLKNVVRKYSNKTSWSAVTENMKSTAQGGLDPTTPDSVLNIWVVNYINYGGSEVLGYAQFPGGDPDTDGVVIGYRYFGNTGTVVSPFNLGRTATHEVGHYLNLRHIWGDATCGNDFVGDTPQHNTYNFGCPSYPHYSTCSGSPVEMTMNYMDYTDDACMYMFTAGQRDRMLATFTSGGGREGFVY